MLTREHRLRDGQSFGFAVRRGRRAGTRTVVLHLAEVPATTSRSASSAGSSSTGPARVGLVVGKAVGNAVVRNTVKRRLRHLVRERLTLLPPTALLVVRALPPAGDATSHELGTDLDQALGRLVRQQDARDGHGVSG